ncbi:MAG: hypothetical protein QM790_19395 [Nibricoccus sp.]
MTHARRAERLLIMIRENVFGDMLYSYSRKQAIEDGVLVDLSHVDSIKQHYKYPFACTATVWSIIESALEQPGQDISGICHDICTMSKLALKGSDDTEQVLFEVIIAGRTHALKLHCGPGDTPAPVLTLMLPNED